MMDIREEPPTPATLLDYSTVSSAFLVASRYRVHPLQNGLGGWLLSEEPVPEPYVKDYDQIAGEGPTRWARDWDIARWGILAAFVDGRRTGGAVVAWDTPGVHMLEGRGDLAVLWDIRVHPEYRGKGIGAALLSRAVTWAGARRCATLKIETQDVNVPACKFYARMGCQLRAIHPGAYNAVPDETQLLWYKPLR